MTVSLLSMEDGRPDIVQAARAIAERVSTGEITGWGICSETYRATHLLTLIWESHHVAYMPCQFCKICSCQSILRQT